MNLARRLWIALLLALVVPLAASAKDLRTSTIRLVPTSPESDWKPTPRSVAATVENLATGEKLAEFGAAFDKWTRYAFPKIKYKLDDAAPTKVKVIVDVVDLGSAGMRFAVGFGAGKGYVRGRVLVEEAGRQVGSFDFTARPQRYSLDGIAREIAPIVILQLDKGDRDGELHEPNPAAEAKAEAK